jgi:hypothetical protein
MSDVMMSDFFYAESRLLKLSPGQLLWHTVHTYQFQKDPVGPSKSILGRIFAATRFHFGIHNIVFFHQLAGLVKDSCI